MTVDADDLATTVAWIDGYCQGYLLRDEKRRGRSALVASFQIGNRDLVQGLEAAVNAEIRATNLEFDVAAEEYRVTEDTTEESWASLITLVSAEALGLQDEGNSDFAVEPILERVFGLIEQDHRDLAFRLARVERGNTKGRILLTSVADCQLFVLGFTEADRT